jgi:predicted XRE-type DNA-binding protein
MTDRYENIRKALEMGPTPGAWSVRYDYVVQAPAYDDGRLVPVAQPYGVNCDGTDLFANAHLIAACNPNTIRALLAERDALREALTAMLEIHGVTQSYAETHIEIPQSWVEVSDIARAALAAQPAAATTAPSDENGGHRLMEPDHETALALADAPRSLRNYVAALQAENERRLAERDALAAIKQEGSA